MSQHATHPAPEAIRMAVVCLALGAAPAVPSFGQIAYGVEVTVRSGHADRGFLINDRLVVQPVTWVAAPVATVSLWSSFPLAETTAGSRPQIVELELARDQAWGHLTIAPALRLFGYRDPLHVERSSSVEGWLQVSYQTGSFRFYCQQSLDVLTYAGAYYGEAGLESEQRLSERFAIGGAVGAGWASAAFNDAYAGVRHAALNRVRAEGWLTASLASHLYITPRVEFSTTVDRGVRAGLTRPAYWLVGFSTGGEF